MSRICGVTNTNTNYFKIALFKQEGFFILKNTHFSVLFTTIIAFTFVLGFS